MHKWGKRSLAGILCITLCAVSLSACSQSDELDASEAVIWLESGESMDTGTANLILRYEQASFENGIGMLYAYYYGLTDIWNTDLYGSGQVYGDTFKESEVEEMEKMLLSQEHSEELGVALTDEEEEAISAAAEQFLADNEQYTDALEAMTATQDSVENMLRFYTLKSKVEAAIAADVDTEVSDEEAAQRTVSYYRVTATVETEEETESVTEDISEDMSEDEESVEESVDAGSAQIGETETEVRTQSAGETEEESLSVAQEAESESETGNLSVAEEATTEEQTEEETETESPEMIEARAVALAAAEDFLAQAQDVEDAAAFDELADATVEETSNTYAGSFTFGDDDSYPDEAIITATADLEDNTLIDQVIVVDDYYYVLYVADAFDEEATEEKKEEIVEERQQDAIDAQFDEWMEDEVITTNTTILDQLLFDMSFTEATEEETEDDTLEVLEEETEVMTEGLSEGLTEGLSESVAELVG